MQLLTDVFKVDSNLLHHLPFMVDLSSLPEQTKSFEQRQHFMTIGNFRHAPNWDAVLYLQQIWPLIRKQLPQAELHIYGSYPPPKATALNNPKTGFLIKGWATDAYQVMESARVCISPLRFGAGIKGKLLEAMIMQTPSVTTTIGSEGMHHDLPWSGVVENEPQQFADAAVALYQNKSLFTQAQTAGNTILKTHYDKQLLSNNLIIKIQSIKEQLQAHREANFTGQMLKHHTMRSTQYMAQWIEAKNK
jgi:glycosyltransferase involved in cell wall biosynthesis